MNRSTICVHAGCVPLDPRRQVAAREQLHDQEHTLAWNLLAVLALVGQVERVVAPNVVHHDDVVVRDA